MAVQDRANILVQNGARHLSNLVYQFFQNDFTSTQGDLLFPFRSQNVKTSIEYWSADRHIVPCSAGIWLACNGFPAQVRHLFLSHCAIDILCFCHYTPDWLEPSDNIAFAALGLLASVDQVVFLKSRFFNAKIHTLFDASITGLVTDCKVALWTKGKDANFKTDQDQMQIFLGKNTFTIPLQTFSLSRFEKATSIRSGIRTHKPMAGFNSYHDFFKGSV